MEKYRITVRYSSERSVYVATVAEVEDCKAEGSTRGEAIAAIEKELAAQLEVMRDQGAELPAPLDEQDFDGKIAVQVTPELHRELAVMAGEANVELSTLLTEMLTRMASGPRRRSYGRDGGRRRSGGPQGQRYHDIMDNRANFIEYVRSLDGDGGGGGGHRGRGGRNRRGGGKR